MNNKPTKPETVFNKVLSEQIKRGLRQKKTQLDDAIERAVEKDKF